MILNRQTALAPVPILLLLLLAGISGTASAGGHWRHPHDAYGERVGYAVPIQNIYQFPAAIVGQPTSPYGYSVPIQNVYQYPAAIVQQPGALGPPPASIEGYGSGHYLFR